jgi:hypothetical protein
MLSIESYIAKRKKEDHLNEWDIERRQDNLRICVNYIFEYFNDYLDLSEADEKTAMENEKLEKYRTQLKDYSPEIQNWLIRIYADYNKKINSFIPNSLKQYTYFYLLSEDSEFRSLSYDCYAQLIKKLPFLQDQTEFLFMFIKEYHSIKSESIFLDTFPFISESLNSWVNSTYAKYQVNLLKFCFDWVNSFFDDENSWPASHRKKSSYGGRKYEYDYTQKTNLFNLDSLYRNMPKKPYTRGKKQEFEIIIMYYWLYSMVSDDDYWQKYLLRVLPSIEKNKD